MDASPRLIHVYLVMITQGAERTYVEVEAPDIETAALLGDGIVVVCCIVSRDVRVVLRSFAIVVVVVKDDAAAVGWGRECAGAKDGQHSRAERQDEKADGDALPERTARAADRSQRKIEGASGKRHRRFSVRRRADSVVSGSVEFAIPLVSHRTCCPLRELSHIFSGNRCVSLTRVDGWQTEGLAVGLGVQAANLLYFSSCSRWSSGICSIGAGGWRL